MLGPVLGAVGFDLLGLPLLFGTDTLTFVASATLLLCCTLGVASRSLQPLDQRHPLIAQLQQSLRGLSSQRPLVTLLFTFMLINALLSIFMVALAPYVLATRSNLELELISAAIGAGMLLSGLLLTRLKKHVHPLYLPARGTASAATLPLLEARPPCTSSPWA
ncbi:hypothetical protein I9018_18355 [Pseudomonas sp. MPFS]|uniref:hypothetical protein n=1 Tax=Pseudomonas sp. MPFS TaxID=2795724 RepID=UPI001F12AECC|nr:hypothetical protein [Pseudomonas sp. MPFS]UMZ09500.1 hypothetical protein I9018_18355 [Pseudomonas sp. MPFS]